MGQNDTTEFTLTDRWGNEHSYLVAMHGASEGMSIIFGLSGLLGPALGSAVHGLVESGALSKAIDTNLGDLEEWASLLDWKAVLGQLKEALADERALPLVHKILRHTVRDNTELNEDGFNSAFRGNYMEALRAVWEVVRINGFLPGMPTSPGN